MTEELRFHGIHRGSFFGFSGTGRHVAWHGAPIFTFEGELIRDLCGSRSQIAFRPLPTDDPKQRRPDITRARKVLGWEPKVSLEEGLKTTIASFRGR